MRSYLQLSALVLAIATPSPVGPELTIVTDQAEAALAILELRQAGSPVPDTAWRRLFESEGYRRLKARETAMGREFEDSTFRAFMTSDTLLRRAPALRRTLRDWRTARLDEAGRKALAYLPAGTPIRARVYLLIKPRINSFVFEPSTDPAIMLYLDPSRTRAQLENTLAHELHHIGYAAACGSTPDAVEDSAVSTARQWLGAFGEGVAMLAAAGRSRRTSSRDEPGGGSRPLGPRCRRTRLRISGESRPSCSTFWTAGSPIRTPSAARGCRSSACRVPGIRWGG